MTENKKSFLSDLWERRFPQFLATYLGVVWGITQFMVFLTERYDFPASIVDRFLFFCLLLLPAVAIFIYNHGRPGKDTWKPYEKILLPLNLLFALGIAGFFGNMNSANANSAPSQIEVTTDDGETITRLVPSSTQAKTFTIFPPINKNKNKEELWAKFAIAELLELDLEQDMRTYCLGHNRLSYDMESMNHKVEDDNIPLKSYLRIARDKTTQYFITGEFDLSNGVELNIKVYDTKSGELYFEEKVETSDLFTAVDEINSKLSENIFLSETESDQIAITDLPVRELITEDIEALKDYCNSGIASNKNNTALANSFIDKAIERDPNSSIFLHTKASLDYMAGKKDKAVALLEKAIDFSQDLPERQQFQIKSSYYGYSDETDKALLLYDSWKKLYPQDYTPYNSLLSFYGRTMHYNKSKEIALDAIDNGHGSRVLKRLSEICIAKKEFEEAEKYMKEYYKIFPDKKEEEENQLASIYLMTGKLDKALEKYQSLNLINPNDHNNLVNIASIYNRKSEFEEAEKYYAKGLTKSKLRSDSLGTLLQTLLYYNNRGMSTQVKETLNEWTALNIKEIGPVGAIFGSMQLSALYASNNLENELFKMQSKIKELAPQHESMFECVTNILVSMTKQDLATFSQYYKDQCKAIALGGVPHMEGLLDGVEAKMKGDNDLALENFYASLELSGGAIENYSWWISDSYRQKADYNKSIEICEQSLKLNPQSAPDNYELLKSQLALNRTEEAKETYKKLASIYENIEPDHFLYDAYLEVTEEMAALN